MDSRLRTPPEAWNISPRNPNFAGRESELARIREELASSPVVTVHGMGGVSKTQAVIEYAWRHADKYHLAWWFNAEQAAVIAGQLVLLAEELGLPPVASPEGVLAAVCRTLRGTDQWLLVFDDAEDAEQVRTLSRSTPRQPASTDGAPPPWSQPAASHADGPPT